MFGKRAGTETAREAPRGDASARLATPVPPPPMVDGVPPPTPRASAPPPQQLAPQGPVIPSKAVARLPDQRSEDYYQIKTTIFGALIDTIDLAQLAQLDPDSAREEIRDIVNEIISIKAVVMSIAEQENLLQDICNDVWVTVHWSRFWRATTSPTSWSTAPTASSSKSAARFNSHRSAFATMRS